MEEMMQVQHLGREDPQEKEMKPTPVFLPGKTLWWRSLAVNGELQLMVSQRVRYNWATKWQSKEQEALEGVSMLA